MSNRAEKKLRKLWLKIRQPWTMRIGDYWPLEWKYRDMVKEQFERINRKPKHDSLVQRMVEHKQEVKALRKR
jgi:hypothetical protein